MASVFVDQLMPWPEHFFPKTCGPLSQLVFQPVVRHRQAAAGASMIARL
jgi:hypothetical protein